MYSDRWLEEGCSVEAGFQVNALVGCRLWADHEGWFVGVSVDFDTDNDFHYELLADDWFRFTTEVLGLPEDELPIEAFRDFLKQGQDMFAFEEALRGRGIPYEKIAFY